MMKGFKPEGELCQSSKVVVSIVQHDHEGSLINYTDFVTSSLSVDNAWDFKLRSQGRRYISVRLILILTLTLWLFPVVAI